MLYVADIFIILSMFLVPKNPIKGWTASMVGNSFYTIAGGRMHNPAIWVLGLIFTVIASYNLHKSLKEWMHEILSSFKSF